MENLYYVFIALMSLMAVIGFFLLEKVYPFLQVTIISRWDFICCKITKILGALFLFAPLVLLVYGLSMRVCGWLEVICAYGAAVYLFRTVVTSSIIQKYCLFFSSVGFYMLGVTYARDWVVFLIPLISANWYIRYYEKLFPDQRQKI